jgi:hypothetical protein
LEPGIIQREVGSVIDASILVGGKFQYYLRRLLYRKKHPKTEREKKGKNVFRLTKNYWDSPVFVYLFIYLFMVKSTVSSAPQDRMNSK